MKSFDRVATVYRMLEYAAFGRALETARFRYVDRVRDCRNILVVGEGDGRFLERLLLVAPQAHVRCIDSSALMLAQSEARLDAAARRRVSFQCADARTADVTPQAYDALVTMFVLDCFGADEVVRLVARLIRGLRPGGRWLFADFSLPARGWRRARAVLWLTCLYAFFRWQTGLAARELPPLEDILQASGLRPLEHTTLQHGLVRTVLFTKPPS